MLSAGGFYEASAMVVHEDLASALTAFLESQRKAGLPETFNFGLYGKDIQYTSQPLLSGLLENEHLLLMIIPEMKQVHRKSIIVRDTFAAVSKRYRHAKVNVSSYSDSVWARWCSHSAILLVEHIHKLSSQPRVLRQVLQQAHTGDVKQKFEQVVDLWVGACEHALKKEAPSPSKRVKKELHDDDDDDRDSACRSALPKSLSSGWHPSSYDSFSGGSALKACLMLETYVKTASDEEQDPNAIQPRISLLVCLNVSVTKCAHLLTQTTGHS